MYNTKDELINQLIKNMPHPHQIENIDTETSINSIYFNWRGSRYKYALSGHIEEFTDGVLIGSDIAILMRSVLNKLVNSNT